MKSVGEAMAIGRTFIEALQKGLRSLENGRYGLGADGIELDDVEEDRPAGAAAGAQPRAHLLHARGAATRHGRGRDRSSLTKIDPWFVRQIDCACWMRGRSEALCAGHGAGRDLLRRGQALRLFRCAIGRDRSAYPRDAEAASLLVSGAAQGAGRPARLSAGWIPAPPSSRPSPPISIPPTRPSARPTRPTARRS